MKIYKKIILFIKITFLAFAVHGCQQASNDSQSEKDKSGIRSSDEKESYLLPGLEHGLLQSPINILSNNIETGTHNITFNFNGRVNKIENLGHTIQLDLQEGNTTTVNGKIYEFKQIHFHTPSEHLIDGITYPMELHVVSTLKDQPENEVTEYLVIALLVRMGKENRFIARFSDKIPEEGGQKDLKDLNILKHSKMGTTERLMMEPSYHYIGSLTTPPYSESVNWYVIKKIFEASPEQILRINELEGDNARHIQAKYERDISNQ